MKKCFMLSILMFCAFSFGQDITKVDSVAVNLLTKMSTVIGEHTSVSFELETANDKMNDLKENERHSNSHKIHMVGPDKMAISTKGDSGNRAIWYNGELFTYYSFDENNYVSVDAPDNIIEMMDDMNFRFGINFPSADLFYPSLVDDVVEEFEYVKYLGLKSIDGEECFHVMASSNVMTFQLWITNDQMFLPKQYLIIEKDKSYQQHQGTFSNWLVNPSIPESIFDFRPPKSAKMISIMDKS